MVTINCVEDKEYYVVYKDEKQYAKHNKKNDLQRIISWYQENDTVKVINYKRH